MDKLISAIWLFSSWRNELICRRILLCCQQMSNLIQLSANSVQLSAKLAWLSPILQLSWNCLTLFTLVGGDDPCMHFIQP